MCFLIFCGSVITGMKPSLTLVASPFQWDSKNGVVAALQGRVWVGHFRPQVGMGCAWGICCLGYVNCVKPVLFLVGL